ncbi:MAG: transporter substrate-binding domain-containing protein, partial [Dehalococcoidales bacterium]|nr:transporter substrate-binding domain-containing protein [Dehalococcoidales bacterium]
MAAIIDMTSWKKMRGNKMRLVLLLGLLLLSAAVLSPVVLANDSITLRVGLYENSPKIFSDSKGNASGFWPDIIDYIASKEGWEIEYVPGTWEQSLTRLENNEIDMMPDVAYSEERSKLYAFSSETVYVSWSRVYARKGNEIESILDLEGKSVAVLAGSVNVEGPEGIKELVRE